jgi:hypothetical protein
MDAKCREIRDVVQSLDTDVGSCGLISHSMRDASAEVVVRQTKRCLLI